MTSHNKSILNNFSDCRLILVEALAEQQRHVEVRLASLHHEQSLIDAVEQALRVVLSDIGADCELWY